MQRNAELHASEDKARREKVETKNQAESMCFGLEKQLKEYADKLRPEDKEAVETQIKAVREAISSDDTDKIKSALADLERVTHAMSSALYQNAQQNAAGAAGAAGAAPGAGASGKDDDAVDAEFEVKE